MSDDLKSKKYLEAIKTVHKPGSLNDDNILVQFWEDGEITIQDVRLQYLHTIKDINLSQSVMPIQCKESDHGYAEMTLSQAIKIITKIEKEEVKGTITKITYLNGEVHLQLDSEVPQLWNAGDQVEIKIIKGN